MLRPLLLIFTLLMPTILSAQVTDRATLHSSQRFSSGERIQRESVERHYTMELLDSPGGREALQRYKQLREQGLAPRRTPLFQYEIGDVQTFTVRNPDESQDDDPIYEEVDFELARSDGNVEIWVETEELSEDRISNAILDIIMAGLIDTTPPNSVDPGRGIVEIVRDLFGEQPDVDGSGTLKILITDIDDGWDPEEQPTFIAGFFDPVNLLPADEFENSNEADIIYINSSPGIYREGMFVSPRLSTMAHELQHLIHAGYGGFLTLFQNEAQSELTEILTGYSSRRMTFLNSPSEVSGRVDSPDGWIYRFRADDPDVVLYDYQRAQLLHSYLEERVGPEAAASLTYNMETGDAAYEAVLSEIGISLEEFLSDFHVTNYGNNRVEAGPHLGYSRPQFINVKVDNPAVIYDAEMQDWILNRTDTLYYGGAHYTQWFGVEDLTLEISATDGVSQQLLYRRGGETTFQLMELGTGVYTLDDPGLYEEIVLVSINTQLTDRPGPGDFRTYTYSGEWTSTDMVMETLSYHGEPSSFYPIPEDDLMAFALRISPEFDSRVQSVGININTRETAVRGEGVLALNLREAEMRGDLYIPGSAILATQTFSPADLAAGENFIGVDLDDWAVEEGEEYFVSLEVVEDLGGLYLELLLDEGTLSETDPNYNPPRTFAGFQEGDGAIGWGYFQQPPEECMPGGDIPCTFHNNLVMRVNLVGSTDGETDPDGPGRPISENFQLAENYPNPFRGQTTIGINVPEPALVKITVHDILGREVFTILDNEVPVGFHSISFDASRLSSGVYFYRMNARGVSGSSFSGVKAMSVIR